MREATAGRLALRGRQGISVAYTLALTQSSSETHSVSMGDLEILWSRFCLPWHVTSPVDEWTQIGRRRAAGSGIQRRDFHPPVPTIGHR